MLFLFIVLATAVGVGLYIYHKAKKKVNPAEVVEAAHDKADEEVVDESADK